MKTFKLNTQILIICCALIASGVSIALKHIGSDGREYIIERDYKYYWLQAWHECARRNRQLLTIDSPEKQDVINELLEDLDFGTKLWLGGNDEFNNGGNVDRPFFWSATGNQFTYANWRDNNPRKIDQHCVLIESGNNKWLNWGCYASIGFICEEKQLMDLDTKFLSLLKDNMAQLNGRLENIEQVGNDTKYKVDQLTNITQTGVENILNKQEISTKELNDEITKEANELNEQLKRTADELNAKFSEKQNFTCHAKNIVLIQ